MSEIPCLVKDHITAADMLEILTMLIADRPYLADAPIGVRVPFEEASSTYLAYPQGVVVAAMDDPNESEIMFILTDFSELAKKFREKFN